MDRELALIKFNILYPENPDDLPDVNEFENLLNILHRMHNQFKDKLLKPSDFSIFFVILYSATQYEKLRQTDSYKENYLKLQIIFEDFNKDVDAVLYFFTIPTTSYYEKMFKEISFLKKYKLGDALLKNWSASMLGFKIAVWWDVKIKRKQTFELKPPTISET